MCLRRREPAEPAKPAEQLGALGAEFGPALEPAATAGQECLVADVDRLRDDGSGGQLRSGVALTARTQCSTIGTANR